MTGMAALAICAAFTSCSKDTDVYNSGVSIINNYNEAFVKTFGQPAANHNWGFVNYAKSSTRDAYPNGNMWADEGWKVPPVISDEQKNIVRQYFQQNTPIGYDDPEWTNFWIQQVYKGGTKTTDGSHTTEKYTIGNGDEVTGGDHMDHLCSKDANGKEDHVNNFNNSDNNSWEGRMLMLNSSTYSFGYINSNATAIHYDKAALVKWDVIAQWAVDKGLEKSVEKSVLNDGWNRSYMGFDWEQALPDDCYSRNITYGSWVAPENRIEGREYTSDGVEILSVTYNTFEFEGNTYKFLSANSNQYAYDKDEPTFRGKKNYNDRPSDATIRQLLSLGYLPYSDTLKDWIKLSTGADGYYSDWIVTLTEAEKSDDPEDPEYTLRVICEDLNAQAQAGDTEDSDWDFNDLVFDVAFLGSDQVQIKVVAVGGTLPIRINGEEALEAHGLYDQGTNIMINTGAGAKYPSQAYESNGIPAKAIFTRTISGVNASYGKNIKVEVKKGNDWIELSADADQPAAKIGVEPTFDYCTERVDISGRYTNFISWIRTKNPVRWWNE